MFSPQLINRLGEKETPFYYYDLDLLKKTIETLMREAGKYNFKVHYALKANSDERVLNIIKKAGMGADCVSGNEVQKALQTGFPAPEIYFAGVGKTDKEIELGLKNNIGCFNCESLQELEVIGFLAGKMKKQAAIALRINPDIDSKTHDYITTGKSENKFGLARQFMGEAVEIIRLNTNLKLIGLHFHIGSQITDMKVFQELCLKVNDLNKWFYEQGFRLPVINLGGGLGIDYNDPVANPIPRFSTYFETIHRFLSPRKEQEVHFEPGRSVVGQMGSLISRVLYIKKGIGKNFAILDSGMTELIRPALYHSFHMIQNLSKSKPVKNPMLQKFEVVGPVCETSDFFGKEIVLPETERGDMIAIRSVGAYGQSMASNYNLRDKAHVVYSDDL